MGSEKEQWKHSSLLDHLFGFNIDEIEARLLAEERKNSSSDKHQLWNFSSRDGNQTWIGLDPQVMLTPYSEQFEITERLSLNGKTLVDLGCGYARMGLFFKGFYPDSKFIGYEVVNERVVDTARVFNELEIRNSLIETVDITKSDFQLPDADIFFIYDFGHPSQIKEMLEKLSAVADQKSITVVARGKGIQSLIYYHHPWLFSLYGPEVARNYIIFRS
ncbi:MAG: hypothetical protein KAG61_06850 [Bacteriovoracaceae bacterium]|nr:hypothetical protein [Bacteriovoracaceae bacterium]